MTYKIVFAGSDQFGVPSLKALYDDKRFEVTTVITNPAKPVGRKQELKLSSLGLTADELGLKIVTPSTKKELEEYVADNESPDFLVVIAYGMIVTEPVLSWAKIAPINVHGSLLPKYRGASPIQTALLNNDFESLGNSIMKMSLGMDEGDVYHYSKLPKDVTITAGQAFKDLSELAAKDLPDVLVNIAEGLEAKPQVGEVTYCRKIKKSDGELQLSRLSAEDVLRFYRAYSPWPGVFYFDGNGKRVILRELGNEGLELADLSPGSVIDMEGRIWLGTRENAIEVLQVQPEGKKVMTGMDWYRGLCG